MNHTEGEWVAISNGHYLEVKQKENQVGGICSCVFTNVEDSIPTSETENVANAKLIAAAPDMLKALIDFNETVDTANFEQIKRIYDQAKKAIKKATT